jgi:hypothetical protein
MRAFTYGYITESCIFVVTFAQCEWVQTGKAPWTLGTTPDQRRQPKKGTRSESEEGAGGSVSY